MEKRPEWLIQFFQYEHLPPMLRKASQPFCELAHKVVEEYPENPERTVALRKLLESKDAAVRAVLAGSMPRLNVESAPITRSTSVEEVLSDGEKKKIDESR